jgi:amino acid adenylation domain-containing protein
VTDAADSDARPRQPADRRDRRISVRPTTDFIRFERSEIEQTITSRFEQQVRRNPEKLALKTTRDSYTYSELNAQANRIAHLIAETHGSSNEPVALLFGQDAVLIAAILGTLKAGKIYVPLDPYHPAPRNVDILRDATASVMLTDSAHVAQAEELVSPDVTVLTLDGREMGKSPEDLGLAADPESFAYLFYTSGSTGVPKGLADTHRNVLHNIMRYTNSLHICADDRLTLLQSASFSGSVSSLFCALLNGATSFPFSLHQEGADRLCSLVSEEGITIYHSVPSIFRLLATGNRGYPRLRIIRLEGDQASPRDIALYRAYFPDTCILVNGLGATECGIVRQYFVDKDTPVPESVVPIGFPVEDMEIFLVDESGQEAQPNSVGEIAIRSHYLAPGYWRKPDRTEAAFLADPQGGSARVYRTGDLGRMRADGCLEYLGRKNFQLKIRGQWVALPEIEGVLLGLGSIKEAAVVAREDPTGEQRLVAYVVPTSQPAPAVDSLRKALAGALPTYMIPGTFVMLDALPKTDAGKVDRLALPAPARTRLVSAGPAAPARTPIEAALRAIWTESLDLDEVGIYDNFFELGGDSLLGTRVLVRIHSVFGTDIPLRVLFEQPTVAALATFVEKARELTKDTLHIRPNREDRDEEFAI